ncbi:unnamed protein product [Prunus brigantina]
MIWHLPSAPLHHSACDVFTSPNDSASAVGTFASFSARCLYISPMIRHLPLAPFHQLARAMSSHPPNDSAFAFGLKLTAMPNSSFHTAVSKLNTAAPNLRHQLLSFRHQLPKLTESTPKLLASASEAYTPKLSASSSSSCVAERHPTSDTSPAHLLKAMPNNTFHLRLQGYLLAPHEE